MYYKALHKRKTAAYHEYQYMITQLDFAWDRLALFKEILPHLDHAVRSHDARAAHETAELRQHLQAVYNSDQECYNVLNRRRNILELRCRVNFVEIESQPHDNDILRAIEAKSAGFLKGYGNSAAIDPLFKKWINAFDTAANKAEV